MGDVMTGLTLVCMIVLGLFLLFLVCHKLDILTWIIAWIKSTREEKIGLTKLKGHFNANGYLVHSDSDIHIGHSGSFKRFDSIDRDIKIATTSFTGNWGLDIDDTIGQPQAAIPLMSCTQKHIVSKECTETSIKPLPRPVSSINMSSLQQSNAQFINPPPSPSTPLLTSAYGSGAQSAVSVQQVDASAAHPEELDVISAMLKRAVSCDSVCSDTSVALGDLESTNITGYLCIALEYDSENGEMIANVLEAKDLVSPTLDDKPIDTYVKIFLLPDKSVSIQTRIYRNSNSPSYQERVIFTLNPKDQMQTALLFHIYATDLFSHTLIGEGELRLGDVNLRQPVTTWVTLTDTGQRGTEFGELMFSLSYLPTAERLTVVVVKARNLQFQSGKVPGDPFVKVYLLQYGKKLHKKKTSVKKGDACPIYNESMMFNIPSHSLQTIQLRLTIAEASNVENQKAYSIGHVIIGAQATGRALSHWNQMLVTLRKPIAMWHPLRK